MSYLPPQCPYGADDCPKVAELREILEQNREEWKEVNANIIRINTTLKNAGYIIGLAITIFTAILGANLI